MSFLERFARMRRHRMHIPRHRHIPSIKKHSYRHNVHIPSISDLEHNKLIPFHNIFEIAGRKHKHRHFPRISKDKRNLNIIDNNNPVKNKNVHIAGQEIPANLHEIHPKNLSGHEYNMMKDPKVYMFGAVIIAGSIYLLKK